VLAFYREVTASTKLRGSPTIYVFVFAYVLCYGCETWIINKQYKRRINAIQIDYLRRSSRVSRLEHISNEEIRKRMDAEESAIDRIQKRGLNWFGHALRTGDERWPQQMYKWKPPGKRKRETEKILARRNGNGDEE
jgi:hypothetical protein